jgi:hypothetical protein
MLAGQRTGARAVMFKDWSDFHLLIGSAAAALIGLLFVVVTLTSNRERSKAQLGATVYMSPIVFHLAVVLVLSGVAMAPVTGPMSFGIIAALLALAGLAWSIRTVLAIHRQLLGEPSHWSDLWCYGAVPGLIYLVLAAVAANTLLGYNAAEIGLALVDVALLLISIRNAWDLVTWLSPRQ